jgi:hypothetical protein
MQFDQVRAPAHTHTVEDGEVRYYTTAPDATPAQIAESFLSGYHQDGKPEVVQVTVERLISDAARIDGEFLALFRGLPDTAPARIA